MKKIVVDEFIKNIFLEKVRCNKLGHIFKQRYLLVNQYKRCRRRQHLRRQNKTPTFVMITTDGWNLEMQMEKKNLGFVFRG